LPKEKVDMDKKVTAFFDWAYKNGADIASSLGYVPLPNALTDKIREYWKQKGI
jgi:phosphate transport system substrate-binding protein